MRWGRRGSLIDWLCTLGVLAVFGIVLYRGVYADWSQHGVPDWYARYLKWEHRVGFPKWWPL